MDIKEFKYSNGKYSFSILNAAAALTSLVVPDKNGNPVNVVLPVKDKQNIFSSVGNLGFTVGRFANRIADAKFSLNGKQYSFEPNNGKNLLHSGKGGLQFKIWDVRHENDGFTCFAKTNFEEDGFPGDFEVWVRYSLTETGVFSVRYKAFCSEDCPVNLTNHSYFNLCGDFTKPIFDHETQFFCSRFVESDSALIPTGRLVDVKGTAFDFLQPKTIGKDFPNDGYDHAMVIDRPNNQDRGYTHFCHIYCKDTGILLNGYTDLPAVHFYTGNFMNEEENYSKNCGFCLETEFYPDCVNHPEFPSCILKAGQLFESSTSYAFSVMDK